MGLSEVVARSWRENHLLSVLLELTYRCNLDCFFCYNDLGLGGVALSTEQYATLLEDLAEMGVLHLALSGGEPLAHPGFFTIGERARALGFVVRVKSNGHALHGALLRRMRERVDPYVVEVSLHGACAATHDRQTRVAGSFERLLANLREARGLGLRLRLNSTLTAWNEGEVEQMLDLAAELGIPLQLDPVVTPRDDGDRGPLAIAASREGVARLFAAQARRAGAAATPPPLGQAPSRVASSSGSAAGQPVATPVDKHCGAGSSGIAIDPYGNVYPCVQWRRPVGNLHRQRIGEIWTAAEGLAEMRALTRAAKEVVAAHGTAGPRLAFCPGLAEALSGDPLRVYPAALQRAAAVADAVDPASPLRPLPIGE